MSAAAPPSRLLDEADFLLPLPPGEDGVAAGGDDLVLPFRLVPASGPEGFLMGSRGYAAAEEPRHRVVIPRSFFCASVPVTQAMFARWTGTDAYREWFAANAERIRETSFHKDTVEPHTDGFPDRPRNPAENVTWWEARAFANWLRERCADFLSPKARAWPADWRDAGAGLEARLPCEAEWEYACRAGTTSEYHSGDGEAALRRVGWFGDNAGGSTHPVGELDPNPWGLYDLHGNVWEWCEDAWDDGAYRKRGDGWVARAWETADESPHRAIRGGSWGNPAWVCRSAYRDWWRPGNRVRILGFRLVLAPVSGVGDPARQAKGGAAAGSGAGSDGTERKAEDGAAAPAENFFEKSRLPRLPGGDGN
ncbi:MAG: formylglycine-generating enzyme family protein [Akkermansiaceae bacterium]|nr:formylglycine-generating enzyme family protein [Akkermansiaceae bacterium]